MLRLPWEDLLLRVARAVHRTMCTVAAARGFTLFLLTYQVTDDQTDDCEQHNANHDGTDIRGNPLQHLTSHFLFGIIKPWTVW